MATDQALPCYPIWTGIQSDGAKWEAYLCPLDFGPARLATTQHQVIGRSDLQIRIAQGGDNIDRGVYPKFRIVVRTDRTSQASAPIPFSFTDKITFPEESTPLFHLIATSLSLPPITNNPVANLGISGKIEAILTKIEPPYQNNELSPQQKRAEIDRQLYWHAKEASEQLEKN